MIRFDTHSPHNTARVYMSTVGSFLNPYTTCPCYNAHATRISSGRCGKQKIAQETRLGAEGAQTLQFAH
jgi:hypothetical protein